MLLLLLLTLNCELVKHLSLKMHFKWRRTTRGFVQRPTRQNLLFCLSDFFFFGFIKLSLCVDAALMSYGRWAGRMRCHGDVSVDRWICVCFLKQTHKNPLTENYKHGVQTAYDVKTSLLLGRHRFFLPSLVVLKPVWHHILFGWTEAVKACVCVCVCSPAVIGRYTGRYSVLLFCHWLRCVWCCWEDERWNKNNLHQKFLLCVFLESWLMIDWMMSAINSPSCKTFTLKACLEPLKGF